MDQLLLGSGYIFRTGKFISSLVAHSQVKKTNKLVKKFFLHGNSSIP